MIKKIISLFFIVIMLLTITIPMFANDTNSGFVTRNEFEERLATLEGKVANLQTNYKSDIGSAIMGYFRDDYDQAFVLSKGVSIATLSYATKNKWQLRSTGNGYIDLTTGSYAGTTWTKKQILDMVDPYTSKYFYVNLKANEGTSTTNTQYEVVKITKIPYGASYYGSMEFIRGRTADHIGFRTWTPDNGVHWDNMEISDQKEVIPFSCTTDKATAKKELTCEYFHSWSNGTIMIIEFTNQNTADNPTLCENGGVEIPIYYSGNRVKANGISEGSWLAGSRITFILENTGNQYEPSATNCKWHIVNIDKCGVTYIGKLMDAGDTITIPGGAENYSYIILMWGCIHQDNDYEKRMYMRFSGDDLAQDFGITNWIIDASDYYQTDRDKEQCVLYGAISATQIKIDGMSCYGSTKGTGYNRMKYLHCYGLNGDLM